MSKIDLQENNYLFSDINEQVGRITAEHRKAVAHADWQRQVFGRHVTVWDLEKATNACANRIGKFYGMGNKYKPHQGKKECERRLAQMSK